MEEKKEVVFSRIFDAKPERVWQVWTEPSLLAQWWGPRNVNIPECEVDLRVGGRIYIVMEAGEGMGQYKGMRWPMEGRFTVVEPKTKLAYQAKAWTEGQEETSNLEQVTEITFADVDGKTQMDLKVMVLKTGPAADMAVQGMQAGFTQQFEKLKEFLAKQ